ncbi:hypothetical protein [Xylanimonas sp. McL0601]|uniref:hypothetical protein n=1 Tax=Xylanimonas sp. McL0601 TaxID=3414739 RepID=UPI003CEB18DC
MDETGQPPDDAAFVEDAAEITYFYLRVAIILLVALLAVAVLREDRSPASGVPLGSISASWYTPVQSIFVAVLVGAGVAMIAIRGRGIQEPLLNVAGLFAPIVAFVPTPEPVRGPCFHLAPDPTLAGQQPPAVADGGWDPAACQEFVARIDGALVPYFWVSSVAIVAAFVYVLLRTRNPALVYRDSSGGIARWFRDRFLRGDTREPSRGEEVVGVLLIALVWGGAIVWYAAGRTSFLLWAHELGGGFVFLPMALVALLAGEAALRGRTAAAQTFGDTGRRTTAVIYGVVALAMVVGIVLTAGLHATGLTDDSHRWFWAWEWVLLGGFWLFWCVQTFEARIPRLTGRPTTERLI